MAPAARTLEFGAVIPITLDHVSKGFGETRALENINLRIEAGEIFFLLGPSGCGKTTLLRTIAGFYEPEKGRVLFGTDDVTHVPPHQRNTGMMFQSYALWPHLTMAQNVAFGLEERRVPAAEVKRRVEEALSSVQMGGLGDRRIHQLSGGQQQRVALARALVIRPRCLLLDEPLSNLDAKLRLEMRAEIRRICREAGLTAVYVTHDQKEALSIADRMAVLEAGKIRQAGTPAEVYRLPQSRFVADFMGESNFIAGKVLDSSPEGVRVETPLGIFTCSPPANALSEQSAVTLSIRPESWKLSSHAAETNVVTGRLRDRIYLGEMAQYRFAAGGQELKIFELNPRHVNTSGDSDLYASAAAEDIVILTS